MTAPLGEEFILIKPSLVGFRAQLEAELKTAMAGIKPAIAVQANVAATRAAAAPTAAAARAGAAARESGAVATANLAQVATASDNVTRAQERLAVAAEQSKRELAGIVLPAGVRDAVTVTRAAAAAQEQLATAATITKKELAGIVLPPGIRSITVASEQAAAAQTKLAAASKAAKAEVGAGVVGGGRTTPSGIIIPGGFDRGNAANAEAARVQKELAATSKATATELSKFSDKSLGAADASKTLARDVQTAETALGRTSRGLVAATAASTGFFRAVSFASGAFLVGAGIGATIGSAVDEFKQMTIVGAETEAIIKATGESANVTAAQVDALAKSQLRLTGTDDELVKKAADVLLTFRSIRNEAGAGNDVFTRSVKAVQDIAAVFNTDLRGSAVQLGKALQDPIRGVTALRRSGITLTQSQRDLIKSLVESGRQLTAQKVILNEVERQVGGTAKAIGQTLPGRLAIMREEAKNSLGELVKRLSESRDATKTFNDVTSGIGDGFKAAFPVIKLAGAAIAEFVKGLQDLGILRPLVKTVTLAAIAFGALKLAIGISTAAQAAYVSATTVAAAATQAETTAAIAAAAAQAALAEGATAASIALAAEGAAAAGAATRISIGGAALAALRGPLGIAIGITAVTVAFLKLRDVLKDQPGTINATRKALDDLNASLQRNNTLRGDLAGARENVSIARFDVASGERGVSRAQAAIAASSAQPGSIEQLGLANRLVDAENKLAAATKALANAQRDQERIQGQIASNEKARPAVIAQTTRSLLTQIDAVQKRTSRILGLGDVTIPFFSGTKSATASLSAFDALMGKLIAKGDPLEQKVGRALEGIRKTLGAIPSQKDIALVVRLAGQGRSLDEILGILGAGRGTEAIRARGITPPPTFQAQLEQNFRGAEAAIKKANAALTEQNKQVAAAKDVWQGAADAVGNAKDAVVSANEALDSSRQQLQDALTSLSDTIKSAHNSIVDAINAARNATNDAIRSAKQNLDSLGQSVASLLQQARDELGKTTAKSSVTFQHLRDSILAGRIGGPENSRAQAATAARISAGTPKTIDTSKIDRAFTNLTQGLGHTITTMPQFNKALNDLLQRFGVNLEALKKTDPALFRELNATISQTRQQAKELFKVPAGRRAGIGEQPEVINIASTIKAGAKSIADAQSQASKDIQAARDAVKQSRQDLGHAINDVKKSEKNLEDANKALQEATDKLRVEQGKQARLGNRLLAANTKATQTNNRLLQSLGGDPTAPKKNKPKPTGVAGQRTGEDVRAGAANP